MGSGAFLVAACRYLAAAYEAALVRTGACHSSDIGEAERAAIRRTIAERCLYGVDLNPMAVQLARLSLWLATLAADRPLSFLDHRLQVGDSLLGTWLANLRHPPVPGRRAPAEQRLPLFEDGTVRVALREALPVRFSLETMPNDTLEQVRAKERAFAALTAPGGRVVAVEADRRSLVRRMVFARRATPRPPSAFGALSDAILTGRSALPAKTAGRYLEAAEAAGRARRLFHWELEFPEVFFDRDGTRLPGAGFDAVIGNPPWDMIRADAGATGARSRARADLAPVLRFTRDAGVYHSQSDGHANRYQLFVERAIALTRPGGRFGLVLPSGLATDHGSARAAADAVLPLRRRRDRRVRQPPRRLSDSSQRPFPAGHGDARRACAVRSRAGSASTTRRSSNRLATRPRTARRGFRCGSSPALLERISGPGLVAAQPAHRDRSRDRRARGVALSAARQRIRLVGALRPGAERQRRSRRLPGRRTRPAGRRRQTCRAVSRGARRRPPAHQRRRRTPAAPFEPAPAPAPRLPRRRQRHQSPDAHRRGAARPAASRPTPSSASARRCPRAISIFSAACSTASS